MGLTDLRSSRANFSVSRVTSPLAVFITALLTWPSKLRITSNTFRLAQVFHFEFLSTITTISFVAIGSGGLSSYFERLVNSDKYSRGHRLQNRSGGSPELRNFSFSSNGRPTSRSSCSSMLLEQPRNKWFGVKVLLS